MIYVLFVCFKGIENSDSHFNNTGGGSDAAQRWLPPDIKQEEEEESVTQRGDLDFTDQNHYKSGMEQNQNPELHADKPVKREEPEAPSASSRTQVSAHDVMIKAPSEADRRHEGRAKMAA